MMDRVSITDALDESHATGCLEVIAQTLLSIDESLKLIAHGQAIAGTYPCPARDDWAEAHRQACAARRPRAK